MRSHRARIALAISFSLPASQPRVFLSQFEEFERNRIAKRAKLFLLAEVVATIEFITAGEVATCASRTDAAVFAKFAHGLTIWMGGSLWPHLQRAPSHESKPPFRHPH